MKEEVKGLTSSQQEAINFRGKNVLVSASAGSGKTFVMISRVLKLILDGEADVDEILAVTYTKLAAREMKQKLVKAIIKAIGEGKETERLKNSLSLVQNADISTFDSFCLRFLHSHFYAANVDPLLAVADESESITLKNRAISRLFNKKYDSGDEDFLYLTRIYRKYRSDENLKSLVLKLSGFASSEAEPKEFLQKCADSITEENFRLQREEIFKSHIERLRKLKEKAEKLKCDCDFSSLRKFSEFAGEICSAIEICLQSDDLEKLVKLAVKIDKSVPKSSAKEDASEISEETKAIKKEYNSICDKIAESGSYEKELKIFLSTKRATQALCALAIEFDALYAEIKRSENKADYADLEHFTYELLKSNAEIRLEMQEKYKYIFADEYQDINGVQEAILNMLSRDNLFMVGDVKQSIYAFRGCNPEIFADKYDEYLSTSCGKAISLDRNFRSADGILKAVNRIFSRAITKEFGSVDYKNEQMQYGGLYKDYEGEAVLHVISGEKPKKEKATGVYDVLTAYHSIEEEDDFYEGALAAEIISEELGKEIFDLKIGKTRKAELGDIAILTRDSSAFSSMVLKSLARQGIPVVSETKTSICDYPEIELLINVMRLIEFYADDVPLASVLKSSVGKLTEEDLAEIRRNYPRKNKTFYECVLSYEKEGEDEKLREKLTAFKDYYERIRLFAEFHGAGETLVKILTETGLDLEITCMPLGRLRAERVERFIAESVKGGKPLTVSEFLRKIEAAPSEISSTFAGDKNSVKVMSMHASKGLEFPIVIIAGIKKTFTSQDTFEEILLDRKLGMAVKCYDENSKTVCDTQHRRYFKDKLKINKIKEETRVFYVATTRAQCRMHLICDRSVATDDLDFSPENVNSFSRLICEKDMKVVYHDRNDLRISGGEKITHVIIGSGRESLTNMIGENLSFAYPTPADTVLPLKKTVTQVLEAEEKTEVLAAFNEEEKTFKSGDVAKKGTAFHKFMEKRDFSALNAEKEIERLLLSGVLSEEEKNLLDENALEKAINSPLFKELDGYEIYREQPFLTEFFPSEINLSGERGKVLVQGIIDLLAVKGKEAIIIDYKTSRKNMSSLKEKYELQLSLYKKAVEKTLGLKVKKKIILNLLSGDYDEV